MSFYPNDTSLAWFYPNTSSSSSLYPNTSSLLYPNTSTLLPLYPNTSSSLSLYPNTSPPVQIVSSLRSIRALLLSLIAVVINVLTGLVIIRYTQLKRPLKVLLLNQITCDIALMSSSFIYFAIVQTPILKNSTLCVLIVYFIAYGFVLCNASVMVMSFNNFFALFSPYKHNLMFTTRNALLSVMITWIGVGLICCLIIGIKVEPGLVCAPLVIFPKYGKLAIFVVFFIFDSVVISINIALCWKLRRRMRVHAQVDIRPLRNGGLCPRNTAQPWSMAPKCADLDQPSTSNDQPGSENNDNRSPPNHLSSLEHSPLDMQDSLKACNDRHDASISASEVSSNYIKINKIPVRGERAKQTAMLEQNQSQNIPPQTFQKLDLKTVSSKLPQPDEVINPNSATSCKRRLAIARYSRLRNLSMTLIIIALWCTFLDVPFLVLVLYMGTAENIDQAKVVKSSFGIIATSALSIKAIGDPFIYVWRFIQWSTVFRNIAVRYFRRN